MGPLARDPTLRGWFSGRRALVLGLGRSGVAAARLLFRLGARVAVSDKDSSGPNSGQDLPPATELERGGHAFLGRSWDLVVVSPGIPAAVWRPLQVRGIPVWGELELGYRVLSLAGRWPLWSAAITGTNGKTTTTALLGAIFRATGRRTVVAGNIGTPLCAVAESITSDVALALEVSSYQLESAEAFRPAVGAVLNISPDHLARHGTLEGYARAKFRLFQSQGPQDTAVLNAGDLWCRRLGSLALGRVVWFGDALSQSSRTAGGPTGTETPTGFGWDGKWLRERGGPGRWKAPAHLPGQHNIQNALAAAACARALGVSPAAIGRGLANFPGVEHRLQTVRTWRGIRFINDSKATNVDSTRVALDSLPGPLTVILGGEDKGAPYKPLVPLLRKKARAVLLIGEAAKKIDRELSRVHTRVQCGTLERAVERAARDARPGEAVLLSPACASFDQFDNFEHRGRRFKELVAAL